MSVTAIGSHTVPEIQPCVADSSIWRHAVRVERPPRHLERKQQDSADAMVTVARDQKETELRDAAAEMKKEIKPSADALAKSLADFAVRIARA